MQNRIAPPFAPWIWLSPVLLLLANCASTPKVVQRTESVPIYRPVLTPLPAELTAPCTREGLPGYRAGALTVGEALDRLQALEPVLAQCARQVDEIRALQPGNPP